MKRLVLVIILLAFAGCATETATLTRREGSPTVPRPTEGLDPPTSSTVRQATPSPVRLWGPDPSWTAMPTRTPAFAYPKTPEPPTPTPHPDEVKQGQILYYTAGCAYCHGVTGEGSEHGKLARTYLSLDEVIFQVYQPIDEMPAYREEILSRRDVAVIYAYLQSLEATPRPEVLADQPDSATGEALYRYFGCFGCHGYQGEGAFGPRLAGTSLSFEEFQALVRRPPERMPPFRPDWMRDREVAHIYAFLQSLAP